MAFSTPAQTGLLNGFGSAVASTGLSAISPGSLVVVAITSQLASGTSVSVTDNATGGSNTYVMATLSNPGVSQRHEEIWYCLSATGSPTVITVNNGSSVNVGGTVTEWAGGATSVRAVTSITNTSGASPTAAAVTPAVGDLVIGTFGYQAASANVRQETLTGAGGFTALTSVNRGGTTMQNSAYVVATGTSAIGPTYTMSPSAASGAVTVAFVPAAAAPATISYLSASNAGNSTSANVTIPASCVAGDTCFVMVTQNSTDVLTGVTGSLSPIDSNTAASGFPVKLYQFTVTASGALSANTSFAATLSATRAWSIHLVAVRGLNATTPLLSFQSAAGTTALTTHSITTATSSTLLEMGAGKGNGTTVTTWTAPAGWTVRNNRAGFSGFSGSGFIATLDAGTVVAGTYGSDTYTSDQAVAATVSYILSLNGTTGNTAPTVDAGPDQTVDVFDVVTLDGSASVDPDGSIATYTWTQTSGTTVTLSGSGATRTFTPVVSLNDATYGFTLQVTDNNGASSATDPVTITALGATRAYLNTAGTTWVPMKVVTL